MSVICWRQQTLVDRHDGVLMTEVDPATVHLMVGGVDELRDAGGLGGGMREVVGVITAIETHLQSRDCISNFQKQHTSAYIPVRVSRQTLFHMSIPSGRSCT